MDKIRVSLSKCMYPNCPKKVGKDGGTRYVKFSTPIPANPQFDLPQVDGIREAACADHKDPGTNLL